MTMNDELLALYSQELQFIREGGVEFAKDYPKVAERLGLHANATDVCPDPYIERLLEGFAFLTAGIQHKMNARFPVLTQHLLEIIYPNYLAPLPSQWIAQLTPTLHDASLLEGPTIPRGTVLQSVEVSDAGTCLTYTTAHSVQCWPIVVREASFIHSRAELDQLGLGTLPESARSGVRVQLQLCGDVPFSDLTNLDNLSFYLHGQPELSYALYEALFRHTQAIALNTTDGGSPCQWLEASALQPQGFDHDEALLPVTERAFSGHRLLQEYFALPERFRFIKLHSLQNVLPHCDSQCLELVFTFNQSVDAAVLMRTEAECFQLHCTPVVNVFDKAADPISLKEKKSEYLISIDRTRSADFELYSLNSVAGFTQGGQQKQLFYPLYHPLSHQKAQAGYYTLKRDARRLSQKQQRHGLRSHYVGSDAYLAIHDPDHPPYQHDLKHLQLRVTCTNRDLALVLSSAHNALHFQTDNQLPIEEIRCLTQPTTPKSAQYYGDRGWDLIHHLSLNYLSLVADENDGIEQIEQATGTLKKQLLLYAFDNPATKRKIEAIQTIVTQPQHFRLPVPGPITYVRGQIITITVDETPFVGDSAFLLGQVLNEFFQRYTSVHSLTAVRLHSQQRGELHQWMPKTGQQMPC